MAHSDEVSVVEAFGQKLKNPGMKEEKSDILNKHKSKVEQIFLIDEKFTIFL